MVGASPRHACTTRSSRRATRLRSSSVCSTLGGSLRAGRHLAHRPIRVNFAVRSAGRLVREQAQRACAVDRFRARAGIEPPIRRGRYGVAPKMDTPNPGSGEEYQHVNIQLFAAIDPPENRGVLADKMAAP
jgi:hypothetical protein